jgi:hypothetical protein
MSDKTPMIRDLVLSGEPRVQLLPPSVKQRERNRQTRRTLVLFVVLAVTVVAAGTVAAFLNDVAANANLVAAQNQTEDLVTAQGQYSDAARVVALVSVTREAQKVVTSTEVLWDQLMDEITGYLPVDSALDGAILAAPAPWEVGLLPEGPLRAPRVATVTLTIASLSVPDAVSLQRALSNVTGYSDSMIYTTLYEAGLYYTTVELTLDETARSGRFLDDAAGGAAASTDDSGSTDTGDPAPTPSPTPSEGASQ